MMLHLFADPADMQGEMLHVTGQEVTHIRNVLRMKPGEEVLVSNGADGKTYHYTIEKILEEEVLLRRESEEERNAELSVREYLFQGLPKAEKMDLIVQKAVELGAYEIIPVSMHRCVMKLDEKKAAKKVERWQKIAESAAMQSGREIIPKVVMPMTMKEALAYAKEYTDFGVLPYEKKETDESTKALLEDMAEKTRVLKEDAGHDVDDKRGIAIFIGPEGGFEKNEVKEAEEAGIKPISLGRRILRTETAGLCILSWLVYLLEM